jgi:hypothetical protein
MFEDCTGMQNGIQVIDILVKVAIQIRHVLPANSFRFEEKNVPEVFKIEPMDFFGSKAGACRKLFAGRYLPSVMRMR